MNARNISMWLAIVGAVTGAIGIIAAIAGDLRLDVTWGVAFAALALVVLLIGALIVPVRGMYAAGVMAIGVLGLLVAQWPEISRYATDLWTTLTGGTITYETVTTNSFWTVLSGSVAMVGYGLTLITGTVAAIIAFFLPEEQTVAEFRPEPRPV